MSNSFHAHLYFKPEQRALLQKVEKRFVGSWHEEAVGPHPLPMLTLKFTASEKAEIIRFITGHLRGVSVLIHEDTGDDLRDHTVGAEWYGEKLDLDFNHFERIKYEKNARIFPE